MQHLTKPTKKAQVKRDWHLIDVKGKVLGRQATDIAQLLIGKQKEYFAKNIDCGDHVVVVNAKEVKTTGNKEEQKIYTSYSGYPSGLKKTSLEKMRETKPEEIIRRAVSGMLPKNKLRERMLKRLHVFIDSNHMYEDKFSN